MQSRFERNDSKPEVLLSFDPEKMKEKHFVNEPVDVFHLRTNVGDPSEKMLDGAFKVHTSWEGCPAATIRAIATQVPVTDSLWRAPIRITSFPHYVAVICFLIESWHGKDMQATEFLVGKFTIQMRPNDLYCCPVKKDEEVITLGDKGLSYARLKTSFNKKYSETVWLYMNGNRDKVDRYIQTPQDAIALCAVLFSEVIRYPAMFFHNILLMQHLKSWEEFHDNHPMLTGGSWKGGSSKRGQVIVPEKVRRREEKNLLSCVKKIMSHEEKRGALFHSAPENEEAHN
jgi:hypothetical protein